jgi:hypothetical protein
MPQYGAQIDPHRYVQRFRRPDGKWAYVYAPGASTYQSAIKGTEQVKVVVAQGAPTSLRIDPHSYVVEGPPNLVGRQLFRNKNPRKAYYAIARDTSGKLPPAYLYPENYVKSVTAKKAAKFVKASRAIVGLNRRAELMMESDDRVKQDYGLAVWLNNNTQMRIGAHETASSVAPSERGRILKMARDRGWSPLLKQQLLDDARKQTYGLLTLKAGHLSLHSNTATFRFLGKGGKENVYSIEVPHNVYKLLVRKKFGEDRSPEAPLFHPRVNYKHIWRTYKAYGITPHASRGHYADALVKELMKDYRVVDGESGKVALRRFNDEMQARVSDHLNHSRSVTEKSYLAPTTRSALDDFRHGLEAHVGVLNESYASEISDALGEVVLWRELGVGNTVI